MLRHVEELFKVSQILIDKILTPSSHSFYLPQMSLMAGLPESSGGRVRSYPQLASSPWPPCSHMTRAMNNRPVGGSSSET
jgi:hypothetical protein